MRRPRSSDKSHPNSTEIDAVVAANVALAEGLDQAHRSRLRELASTLLRAKRWESTGGLQLTVEVRVTIAANAAIPHLGIDADLYRQVRSIIVHPTIRPSRGVRRGPVAGTVADRGTAVMGLASPNFGPLSISWAQARAQSRRPELGRNVVIHEFAHKIDMSDGYSDGTPPLRRDALLAWTDMLGDEYYRADPRPGDEVLRPYAWTNPGEFFAVATETFFCDPVGLAAAKPRLYAALSDFYGQDPADR